MMKEKARLTKVKGTVLFTVVSVMMVLIVFLMGTLALAATANNRANRNYQKEQTEATARAVLDAVVEAINQDDKKAGGLADEIGSLATGSEINFDVTIDDGVSPKDYPVTITKTEERPFYADEKWQKGSVYSVSTTVRMTSTDVETVYTAYMSDADVNTGSSGGGGGGGGGAFVSMGGTDGKIGTSGFIAGGTQIGIGSTTPLEIEMDNQTIAMAPFYANGNLTLLSQVGFYFTKVAEGEHIAVVGDLTLANDFKGFNISDQFKYPSGEVDYKNIPTVYVEGKITLPTSDVSFGNSNGPINVYCGNITKNKDNKLTMYGNLYCFGTGKSVLQDSAKGSELYKWTKSQIVGASGTAKDTIWGDLYSKGDVELGMPVNGNVRVEKNLEITQNVKVGVTDNDGVEVGDVVVGDTLTIDSGVVLTCKNVYATTIVNNGTIQCTGKIYSRTSGVATAEPMGYTKEWYTDFTTTTPVKSGTNGGNTIYSFNASYIKHTQNVALDGTTKEGEQADETVTNPYDVYLWENDSATAEEVMEVVNSNKENRFTSYLEMKKRSETNKTYESAETSTRYKPSEEDKCVSITTAEDAYGTIYPEEFTQDRVFNDIIGGKPDATKYKYPTTVDELSKTTTVSNDNVINFTTDTTSGNSETNMINTPCRFTGTISRNVYIDASQPIAIILDGVTLTANGGVVGNIIVVGHKPVYFLVRGELNLTNNANILTQYYYNIHKNGAAPDIIYMNQESESTDQFPNIYIYGEVGSKMVMSAGKSVVSANIQAQEMDYEAKIAWQPNFVITYRTGFPSSWATEEKFGKDNNQNLGVIGQLITKSSHVSNGFGLMYITTGKKECNCGHCSSTDDVTTHDCSASCTDTCGCICDKCSHKGGGIGGGSSSAAPDKLYTMYYNYY